MKKFVLILSCILLVFSLLSCNKKEDYSNVDNPIVTMVFKDFGTVEIELYPEIAPNTVKSFIELIEKGFYDGLTIHRVSPGFVLQGGDPEGTGRGGPGYSIPGEFSNNGYTNNLKHTLGVLSMARSQKYDSAGSQFFIMLGSAPYLDGDYAGFGKVIEGLDVVLEIGSVDTKGETPTKKIIIEKVTVDTKGVEYGSPKKIK